jgi:Lyzozyme M1 (1,4-beta-N-acetylmuramidase)
MKKILKSIVAMLMAAFLCTGTSEVATAVASEVATKGVDGIDVSHHQGIINWKKVADNNFSFVYIKVTEGASYIDPMAVTNIKGAKAAGMNVGVYHFFRMTSTPAAQFKNFKKILDKYDFDLIPMVDVESRDKADTDTYRQALSTFLNMIESKYGVVPMIYGTNRSYNELCGTAFDGKYPLYIGRYGSNRPVVKGKSVYTIWQYSEHGKVSGISKDVDLCRFRKGCGLKDILWNSQSVRRPR